MFLMRVAEQQSRAIHAQKKNAAYSNAVYSSGGASATGGTPKGKKGSKKSGRYGKNLHPNLMSVYGEKCKMSFLDHHDNNYAPILENVSQYHALVQTYVCEYCVKVCISSLKCRFSWCFIKSCCQSLYIVAQMSPFLVF